jgi:hypothetical protein
MVAESPYTTALALNRPAPTHVRPGVHDADRVRSYYTYQDIWNNVPTAFSALLRAGDDPLARRYLPVIRSFVESTNRYLAQDMETGWTPIAGATVSDEEMAQWQQFLGDFWAREEVSIKFLSMKRWWLIKGDALLMISADAGKLPGSRLRLTEVEPEQYFPISDPGDSTRITGCYLASIVQDDDENDIVQRIEYHKVTSPEDVAAFGGAANQIFYRIGFYELTGWDDRPGKNVQDLSPVPPPVWASTPEWEPLLAGFLLPTLISSIPVYHFRNNRKGGQDGAFGVSEVQGLESIFAGVIQNTTDEDLAVALQGLGVYWTDSGRPRDANGRELPWEIGPASMIELEKDGKLGRVAGVGSVQPIQDHMTHMVSSARESSGIPDIAVGRIDAQAAQSGVALRIEFMPVLAKNAEKEEELSSKLTQLLHDLVTMWIPTYEEYTPPMLVPSIHFGDPIPTDRAAVLAEILQMVAAKVVSIEWAQTELAKRLGYVFPSGMLASIVSEQTDLLDVTGARIDSAAAGSPDPAADPNAQAQ